MYYCFYLWVQVKLQLRSAADILTPSDAVNHYQMPHPMIIGEYSGPKDMVAGGVGLRTVVSATPIYEYNLKLNKNLFKLAPTQMLSKKF